MKQHRFSRGLPQINRRQMLASGTLGLASVAFSPLLDMSNVATAFAASTSGGFGPPQAWTSSPFYGTRGTLFANLLSSQYGSKESVIAINDDAIYVKYPQAQGGFGPTYRLTPGPFYGTRETLFATISIGGAYPIAINDDAIYYYDHVFWPPTQWTPGPFYGTRGTFIELVSRNFARSPIAVNDDGIYVMPNFGINQGFGPVEKWTSGPYYGTRETFFADVDGDGRAEAIAVNDDAIYVKRSTDNAFGPTEKWTPGPYYGTRETFFADVDGDGRADAIAVNDDAIYVKRSTGSGFGPTEKWTPGPYYGVQGTFFANVGASHFGTLYGADAIVVNSDKITVRLAPTEQ